MDWSANKNNWQYMRTFWIKNFNNFRSVVLEFFSRFEHSFGFLFSILRSMQIEVAATLAIKKYVKEI